MNRNILSLRPIEHFLELFQVQPPVAIAVELGNNPLNLQKLCISMNLHLMYTWYAYVFSKFLIHTCKHFYSQIFQMREPLCSDQVSPPPLHLRILDSSIPSRMQHGSASQCRLYLQVSIANHILNHFFNLFLGEVLGKLLELLF